MELDTDELESIDLSSISNITEEHREESKIDEPVQEVSTEPVQEQVEETLETRLENLNNQLTEKKDLLNK